MTNQEALQIIIKTTELRLSASYQAAEARRQASSASEMANASPSSQDHGAIRLLIGTWDRIAMFVEDFNPSQRRRFFRCNPVRLVWTTLWPAIEIIRNSENAGPGLAAAFEALADQYQQWTETADGRDYRTESQQAVCALFF